MSPVRQSEFYSIVFDMPRLSKPVATSLAHAADQTIDYRPVTIISIRQIVQRLACQVKSNAFGALLFGHVRSHYSNAAGVIGPMSRTNRLRTPVCNIFLPRALM